jgi:hypothetical protein
MGEATTVLKHGGNPLQNLATSIGVVTTLGE